MEVQPDFKELLKLLNAHKAEFIIVGAYALAFHGVPRLWRRRPGGSDGQKFLGCRGEDAAAVLLHVDK